VKAKSCRAQSKNVSKSPHFIIKQRFLFSIATKSAAASLKTIFTGTFFNRRELIFNLFSCHGAYPSPQHIIVIIVS